MDIKTFLELIKMEKKHVELYSKNVSKNLYTRNYIIKTTITDEKEKQIQFQKLQSDSSTFTKELIKYLTFYRITNTSSIAPKRRYSV